MIVVNAGRLAVLCCFLLASTVAHSETPTAGPVLRPGLKRPDRNPVAMTFVAQLERGPGAFPGKECSGIVRSRTFPDLFWVQNDSGDEPRIYPLHANGSSYTPPDGQPLGILLKGIRNLDWEDVAVDSAGRLIVADTGNNLNQRRDLVFYVLPEPKPDAAQLGDVLRYPVRYPNQTAFPPQQAELNFDCEAVFTVAETIYCLTKHRGNLLTTLYRLDQPRPNQENVLTQLATIDLEGMVVGADASPDGKRLVVLTYGAVWLFERSSLEESFFEGVVRWAPLEAQQAEAICFADDHTLKLVEELTGKLYDIQIRDLSQLPK